MAHIGSEWWQCDRCGHRLQVKDAHGKPYKKVPPTCPSCGLDTKKGGGPPTKDSAKESLDQLFNRIAPRSTPTGRRKP